MSGMKTPTKMSIYKWYKLIGLVAFVREKHPGDDQSLKHKGLKFQRP
jgi:hypothetical protein